MDANSGHSMVAKALILLIRIYQLTISPLLGPCCRFEPSCSRYAARCLELHGALAGSWLALRRLMRCHPFHPGGYDPPPIPPGDGQAPVPGQSTSIGDTVSIPSGDVSPTECREHLENAASEAPTRG